MFKKMKKYLILLGLIFVAFISYSQERTVTKSLGVNETRWNYTGTAADTLKENNQDTIDFRLTYKSPVAVEKIDIFIQADSIAGNDSIYVSLLGKKEPTGAATTLIASTGILVNQLNKIKELTVYQTVSYDTVGKIATPRDLSFQEYILRAIQAGTNGYDGGAKFDYIRFKLYQK